MEAVIPLGLKIGFTLFVCALVPIYCQLGDLESAKRYLKRAFEIDPNWRIAALDDKDLEPLWASI